MSSARGRAALDLAAFPGSPLSFATVGDQSGVNVGIYDGGVLRSGSGAGGNNIQFGAPNVLYGEGNNSGSLFINIIMPTSFEFKDQVDIDTRGLRYSDGLLYTSNGHVIDPATRTITGQFPTQSLLVDRLAAVSSSDDRVYINTWNPSTPKHIVVWNRTGRTQIADYDTGFMPGGSENFIACGNHTVAFNAFGVSTKSIVIVRNLPDSLIGPA